jgi:hypothetical protein
VLAPMPRARVRTATRVKPGLLRSMRKLWRRSRARCSNHSQPHTIQLFSLGAVTLPNRRRAAVRAESAVMPDSRCSCWRSSKCNCISSSRSASNWQRCMSIRSRLATSRSQFMPELLSDRFNHTRGRPDDALELRYLDGQLPAACCSQLVLTSAAVASRPHFAATHPLMSIRCHGVKSSHRGIVRLC